MGPRMPLLIQLVGIRQPVKMMLLNLVLWTPLGGSVSLISGAFLSFGATSFAAVEAYRVVVFSDEGTIAWL
jgi:hypothetical protein